MYPAFFFGNTFPPPVLFFPFSAFLRAFLWTFHGSLFATSVYNTAI